MTLTLGTRGSSTGGCAQLHRNLTPADGAPERDGPRVSHRAIAAEIGDLQRSGPGRPGAEAIGRTGPRLRALRDRRPRGRAGGVHSSPGDPRSSCAHPSRAPSWSTARAPAERLPRGPGHRGPRDRTAARCGHSDASPSSVVVGRADRAGLRGWPTERSSRSCSTPAGQALHATLTAGRGPERVPSPHEVGRAAATSSRATHASPGGDRASSTRERTLIDLRHVDEARTRGDATELGTSVLATGCAAG